MVSATTIEQLARDTVQIADPQTALRALTALRKELDATEPKLVQRALRAGASWSQVARALGVTKQAAHRKYRHLFEPSPAGPSDGALVTSEARQCIQFAREEANRLAQPAVGTEHILLGILRCGRGPAVKALKTLGVTLEAARGCLRTTMPGVPARTPGTSASEDAVTPHARRIIDGALREAQKRGQDSIGVEDLLLALLSDSRNGAVQTLEELKAMPRQIRRQLERELAPAPVQDVPPAPVAPAHAVA